MIVPMCLFLKNYLFFTIFALKEIRGLGEFYIKNFPPSLSGSNSGSLITFVFESFIIFLGIIMTDGNETPCLYSPQRAKILSLIGDGVMPFPNTILARTHTWCSDMGRGRITVVGMSMCCRMVGLLVLSMNTLWICDVIESCSLMGTFASSYAIVPVADGKLPSQSIVWLIVAAANVVASFVGLVLLVEAESVLFDGLVSDIMRISERIDFKE